MEKSIDKAEFDKRFLALVNQTDVVITAPNIAYHLSLPIEETQEHLLGLELNGVLQPATDDKGSAYYILANRAAPGTMPAGNRLLGEAEATGNPPGVHDPASLPSVPIYSNPGAKGMNINGLVFNCIVPGAGSIVTGHKNGFAMLALMLLGILLFFMPLGFGRFLGVFPIIGAYIWSIIAGIGMLSEQESGPGIPK